MPISNFLRTSSRRPRTVAPASARPHSHARLAHFRALRRLLAGRIHPRCCHGRHRSQDQRRRHFSLQQWQSRSPQPSPRPMAVFRSLPAQAAASFLVVSAKSFRQLQTPDFYAGQFDSIERNIVLEPAWVRESIVVTATGTPTPQPQTSAATTVLGPLDLAMRDDLTSVLRLMPGTFVVQTGQLGAQSSLFIRGGDSDNNKVLVDGVDAGDLGRQFSFGPLSTTGDRERRSLSRT